MESQQIDKVELPNQCLGITFFGEKCTQMLPKGKHICGKCQRRIDESSKSATKMSSGNGRQKRSYLQDG